MGVPNLFKTLFRNHPEIVRMNLTTKVDCLYFDFNCLIHLCKSQIESTSDDVLIKAVIDKTVHIINTVNPYKLVYIAIDGPVPLGKVVRQRERRWKTLYDNYHIDQIYKRYNSVRPETFDSNKISPGTKFMQKLNDCLHTHFKTSTINVIISDSNEAGEGEFKIFNHMRGMIINNKWTSCIYSIDADLIVLSMSIRRANIYLYRETDESEKVFIDINTCKIRISKLIDDNQNIKQRIINDLCFLSFMGGNDFVPSIIQFKIREGGWDNILKVYIEYRKKWDSFIITLNNNIDTNEFYKFCNIAAIFENEMVYHTTRKRQQKRFPKPGMHTVDMCIKNHIEEYNHGYLYTYDPIDYTSPNWREQYNNMYINDQAFIAYLYALTWCWKYYNGTVPSWDFTYPFHFAPSIKDLLKYIHIIKTLTFETGKPMTPLQQLICILPPECKYLLPENKRKIQNRCKNMYPDSFDMLFDTKMIYSIPLLPPVDLKFIYSIK